MNRHSSGIALACVVLMQCGLAAGGQTIAYVDDDARPGGDGASWAAAFSDLQSALVAARAAGATIEAIWIAGGSYAPHESDQTVSFELVPGVSLYGGFFGDETSIDQRDLGREQSVLSGDLSADDRPNWGNRIDNADTVVVAEDCGADTVLDGFTIYGGHSGATWGAGMRAQGGAIIIRNCRFESNLSGGGGGIMIWDCDATVESSAFVGNYTHLGTGAGIRTQGTGAPTIVDCLFEGNTSVGGNTITPEGAGGGVDHRATGTLMTVRGCTFRNNVARPFWAVGGYLYARGGGLHSFLGNVEVRDCVFVGNQANAGGGLYAWRAATVVNCLFDANEVDALEGDIVDYGGYGAGCTLRGSGETSSIVNTTVVRNVGEAGAVTALGDVFLNAENCVLWGNTATGAEVGTREAQIDLNDGLISHSCVEGLLETVKGEDPPDPADYPGSFDDDPGFADFAGGDFHLGAGSPCVDTGDNAAVPVDVITDLDGQPRFVDDPEAPDEGTGTPPIVDMGAFERQIETGVRGDVDGDGDVDFSDLLALVSAWGACPPPPAACPADLDHDGSVGFGDLILLLSNWSP